MQHALHFDVESPETGLVLLRGSLDHDGISRLRVLDDGKDRSFIFIFTLSGCVHPMCLRVRTVERCAVRYRGQTLRIEGFFDPPAAHIGCVFHWDGSSQLPGRSTRLGDAFSAGLANLYILNCVRCNHRKTRLRALRFGFGCHFRELISHFPLHD